MRSIEVRTSRRVAASAALCAAGALSLAVPGAGLAAGTYKGASAPKQTDTVSSSGVAPVTVSCPSGTSKGCTGTLTLKTAKAVKVGKSKKVVTLGTASFSQIKPGKRTTVKVTLSSDGKKLVKSGSLSSNAVVASRDGAGHKATKTSTITLKKKKTTKKGTSLPPSSGSY